MLGCVCHGVKTLTKADVQNLNQLSVAQPLKQIEQINRDGARLRDNLPPPTKAVPQPVPGALKPPQPNCHKCGRDKSLCTCMDLCRGCNQFYCGCSLAQRARMKTAQGKSTAMYSQVVEQIAYERGQTPMEAELEVMKTPLPQGKGLQQPRDTRVHTNREIGYNDLSQPPTPAQRELWREQRAKHLKITGQNRVDCPNCLIPLTWRGTQGGGGFYGCKNWESQMCKIHMSPKEYKMLEAETGVRKWRNLVAIAFKLIDAREWQSVMQFRAYHVRNLHNLAYPKKRLYFSQ